MVPKYKAVKYVWKMPRPLKERYAEDLMDAAYFTAMETDPDTKEILIRSDAHSTTRIGGEWVADPPHITVSCKNAEQVRSGTHQTSHGYTKSLTDLEILRVTPDGFAKADNTMYKRGKTHWPEGLPEEEKYHPV
ncbi:MAG: hypothetical protein Q9208_000602 [Pyrenodesmia sp. 3 TL-2023]